MCMAMGIVFGTTKGRVAVVCLFAEGTGGGLGERVRPARRQRERGEGVGSGVALFYVSS